MAERITTTRLCDYHLLEDIEELAEEGVDLPPIALGPDKPRKLDLCKQCRVDHYEPFITVVRLGKEVPRTLARSAPSPKARRKTVTEVETIICDGPTGCSRQFKNEAGLKIHQGRNPSHKSDDDA